MKTEVRNEEVLNSDRKDGIWEKFGGSIECGDLCLGHIVEGEIQTKTSLWSPSFIIKSSETFPQSIYIISLGTLPSHENSLIALLNI